HYNRFNGNAFPDFWRDHLTPERKVLFIVGLGFDPRALQPLGTIAGLAPSASLSCIAINFASGFTGDDQSVILRGKNQVGLKELFDDRLDIRDLEPTDSDGIRSISRNTITLLSDVNLSDFTDVVVDISSLPRIMYL
ncbi:hypothetical protein GR238_38850, partial [Rhizobium leguminosarum]|uniref:hypothetical protein n=1 Tax=Rhizobium ruizarguesonis TaxID=2081791 RepID=UPI0013BDED49